MISPSMVEPLEVGDEYARLKFEHDLIADDYPYLNTYCEIMQVEGWNDWYLDRFSVPIIEDYKFILSKDANIFDLCWQTRLRLIGKLLPGPDG